MTPSLPPTHGERRPIASRNHAIWRLTADILVRAHISANLISVLGMVAAFLAAAALAATPCVSAFNARILFLLAAVFIQARLVANMLDGMVAIGSGKPSPLGELFNLSIAGQFGDLTLSSVKRDLGIKDWANTFPGHGGLLDRFNSLIFAAPAVFHYIGYVQGIGLTQPTRIFL